MARTITILLITVIIALADAVGAQSQKEVAHTVYLVGDAGKVTPGQTATFEIIRGMVTGKNESVVFLGDNIYQQGLPETGHEDRQAARAAIDAQLALARLFGGNSYFIPGNHDWAQGRSIGWSQILRQEQYVETSLNNLNIFLPDNGCPGPVAVELSEDIVLIVMDTQWFLHRWDKPDTESGGCELSDPVAVLEELEQLLKANSHRKVIVATHHPMFTYGQHGGVFKPKDWLLPPVIGAIYPVYRKVVGSIQDVTNSTYKMMKEALVSTMSRYPNTIHAAGHEHALQYAFKDSVHYIVSGSGSKTTYVKKKGYAQFAEPVNGFARLLFLENGDVMLEMWRADGSQAFAKRLMSKPVASPPVPGEEVPASFELLSRQVTTHASDQYDKGKVHRGLFGENYRKEWRQPLDIPVFDIGKEHGGLKVIKKGGGQQTKSLRLEAKDGKQYVLRSVEKYAEGAIPDYLVDTFLEDVVQDQISSSHPYGAFIIPPLAEAAGIYHTNPKPVFIPDDPRLGKYRAAFANTLALYEERPAKDWADADYFGNSPDIENTAKVLSNLRKDNDHYVDQEFVLRSRLFDLLIGDWDRHDDQWRWAETDEGKGNRYRPIPRDRDQAFFVNEGVFPSIWKRKWALPKFEGFDYEIDWPSGLSFNARYFDRTFLTAPEKQDWLKAAGDLQSRLTDEVIENAVKTWPEPVFDLHGEEVIAKLKSRRNQLAESAAAHYAFLARAVDVLGSDKREHFKAERLPNGDVKVEVRKMKKDGDKKQTLYERTFKADETKEIRLYGFGGDDEFEIEGKGKKGIKIRVIGGEGHDELDDDSEVRGLSKENIFYDTREGNTLKLNKESRDRLSENPRVNSYHRKAFKYNVLMPLVTGNFNPDDGVFLGGGFVYTNHGFRKEPFQSRHKVLASYAINTSSYNFNYNGQFTDIFGRWSLGTDVIFNVPNFVNNFFGMGNESGFDTEIDETVAVSRPIDYYRMRFEEIAYEIGLFRPLGAFGRVGITHDFVSWELDFENKEPRFVTDIFIPGTDIENERTVAYIGGGIRLDVDTRKNAKNPHSGILWTNKLNTLYGVKRAADDYHRFNTSLAVYHSFRLPARLTFAARVGWGINFGDYPFFRGQTLGGNEQIRGYRKTRFYGDERFYSNVEARMKLLSFRGYILPATLGILAFHDVGRVWLQGEKSDRWHRGVGGGIWLAPFNMAVFSAEVGVSEEETLFYLRMGFLF